MTVLMICYDNVFDVGNSKKNAEKMAFF